MELEQLLSGKQAGGDDASCERRGGEEEELGLCYGCDEGSWVEIGGMGLGKEGSGYSFGEGAGACKQNLLKGYS